MTIRIVCPNRRCRRVLRLDAEWVHHINVRCVKCGELFVVYAKDGYCTIPAVTIPAPDAHPFTSANDSPDSA